MIELKQFQPAPAPLTKQLWDVHMLWQREGWRIRIDDVVLNAFAQACRYLSIDDALLTSYEPGQIPLPEMERLAAHVRDQVLNGEGLAWITGLSPSRFSEREQQLFYLMLGTAMGQPMEQYGRLYEVKDRGSSYTDKPIPVSQTRAETTFHTDSSARDILPDLVGLLCLQPAYAGGESLVSSAVTAHEQLRYHRADQLRLLYREFIRDMVTPGAERTREHLARNRFPIFSYDLYTPGLTFRYMRYWIEKGHELVGAPLESECVAALDHLDAILSSNEHAARFLLKAGDILWVNNHTIAHNRTQYEDAPGRPRRMLRMWIKV